MLSIVIPLYNSRDNIWPLVDSLLIQHFEHPFEIIVIDDCSSDESMDSLRHLTKHGKVLLLKNEHNMWNGFTKNLGAARAKGRYVFFIDDHCIIGSQFFLQNCFDAFRKKHTVWASFRYEVLPGKKDLNVVRDARRDCLYGKSQSIEITQKNWTTISAVAFLIDRRVFAEFKFPENFWNASAEDTFFQLQVESIGWRKFDYIDDVSVYHSHSLSEMELYRKCKTEAHGFFHLYFAIRENIPHKAVPFLEGYLDLCLVRFVLFGILAITGYFIWGCLLLMVFYSRKFFLFWRKKTLKIAWLTILYIMLYDLWKIVYLAKYSATHISLPKQLLRQYCRWKSAFITTSFFSYGKFPNR